MNPQISSDIREHTQVTPGALLTTALRTPDERFVGLKGWSYAPKYIEDLPGYEGLRLHYIDVGKPNATRTALCLHGQKSWSYAFRKTFDHFIGNGYRVIAPDFFGFGRSDKPSSDQAYDFEYHRNAIIRLIEALDLDEICLTGFDWGGWIAAALPMDLGARATSLLLGNTVIHEPGQTIWSGFHTWKALHNAQIDPVVGRFMQQENGCLCCDEASAYDAPFPTFRYKAGVRRFPNLVPLKDDHQTAAVSRRALRYLSENWTGKTALVAGTDPIQGTCAAKELRRRINGANPIIKVDTCDPLIFEHADHFMPEALEMLV